MSSSTKIRGRQIETDDFIKSERHADVNWADDTNTASQKAIADLVHEASDRHFVYEWSQPATRLTVAHNLNKNPSVTVVDTAGSEIVCDVRHDDDNTVTLVFSAPLRGTAYFN